MSNNIEDRILWLENHCVLCKEEFDKEQVYPHDKKEDDACICLACKINELKENDDLSIDFICHSCEDPEQGVIGFCTQCDLPVCESCCVPYNQFSQITETICEGCHDDRLD